MLPVDFDSKSFALAVVSSSNPEMTVQEKLDLYNEAFKHCESQKANYVPTEPKIKGRKDKD